MRAITLLDIKVDHYETQSLWEHDTMEDDKAHTNMSTWFRMVLQSSRERAISEVSGAVSTGYLYGKEIWSQTMPYLISGTEIIINY